MPIQRARTTRVTNVRGLAAPQSGGESALIAALQNLASGASSIDPNSLNPAMAGASSTRGSGTLAALNAIAAASSTVPPSSNAGAVPSTPAVVVNSSAPPVTVAASTAAVPASDWTSIFTEASFFGVPNWMLLAGGGLLLMMGGRK